MNEMSLASLKAYECYSCRWYYYYLFEVLQGDINVPRTVHKLPIAGDR